MSLTSWFLVSSGGTKHRLPREMIFVGRDDCELMLQSRSVDKQHAVINYEMANDEHKVKDLGSLNGTFVNDVRIQEQTYITLKIDDKLRFGYDTNLFTVERGELHVPEEALKHEKFTSQLQLGKKPPVVEPPKAPKTPKPASTKTPERKAAEPIMEPTAKPAEPQKGEEKTAVGDISALHRGTPLYGQPSWWGDGDADDENSFKQETKTSGKKQENCGIESREGKKGEKERAKENGLAPVGADPSYFEIPSKEGGVMADSSIHEIPTKDTEGSASAAASAANVSSQGHASFTIEFDSTSPGKVTIKDHVAAKLNPETRSRGTKKSGQTADGKELSTLQVAMMASETKVADWLAQNDPPLVRRESTEEDSKTIKSDVPVHFRRLKGSKHEDGTQSDSENGPGLRFGSRRQALEERLRAVAAASGRGPSPASSTTSRTSFMVELYDEDNPRKRRSYSFSQTAPLLGGGASTGEGLCPTPPPARPKVATMATEAAGKGSPSPLTSARVLQKQRSEEPGAARSSVGTGKSASPTEETHKQDGDDQSDKGTYTIELENRNPEEEEARRMIDKVFGVQGGQDGSCGDQQQGEGKPSESKKPSSKTAEVVPDDQVAVGSPHWVSQWASLTANHTRTDPEGSGAEPSTFVHQEREPNAFDSSLSQRSAGSTPSSLTERKRRTLPQLPAEEKPKLAALGLRSEIGEKQDTEPQEKENHSEHKGDGQSLPSSEGKMGTANGVALEGKGPLKRSTEEARRRRAQEGRWSGSESGEKSGRPLVRQGSFTIERPSGSVKAELIPIISRGDGSKGRERSDSTGSMDTATLLKDTEAVMAFLEAKLRDDARQEKQPSGATVSAASSSSVSKSHHRQRAGSISPESDVDTASTVSQAAGEGERKPAPVKRRSLSSLHREKSNASASSVATTRATAASARDRLERKAKTRTPSQALSSTTRHGRQPSLDLTDDDLTSSHPLSTMSDVLSSDQDTSSIRSYGRGGHFASTDDLMFSRTSSSAKISRSNKAFQGSTGSLAGKQSQQVQQQQQALPLPRPTRASLLRRARLGDTSDTDLADMDRVSVASEVSTTSSTSRPPSGRKAPSRIDMLAQPRRTRLGSMSARSDSEATVGVRNTATRLSAETALRLGLRQPMPGDGKLTAKSRASSISKLNDVKAKVTPPTHGSPSESPEPDPEAFLTAEEMMVSSRWRRLTPEYASTSEDEFGSNRNLSKHGRPLRTPPTLRGSRMGGSGSAPATPGAGSGVLKHRMREHDEYIRDWTAHSEEIARISQDLAKDLAVLAREIHDVAGEIDSVSSSGTAPSTTLSTAATTPGSAIDTREEVRGQLVDRVFDESLNFRKIPPMVQPKAPEINGRPVELRPRAPDSLDSAALRRRTWNRDEAVLDSLLLTSVSQLSAKIRHSVDKTASKIRILFKDKDRNWDDIESKLRAESDIPLLKTSNKEISSILLELKRVEKQLQVINVMVDPDGTLDALTSLGLTSPVLFKPRTSPSSQTPPAPLPGPGATKAPAGATSPGDCQRDLGLSFTRTLPSGKEAAAVASK
ncbi:centrosomal protein of 170 kDa isoform X3 [Clupea harengus]|uniref:Centrosomal protein of 170 kDa isoform X3 n=1 Tax=Clupea harengus TaxID=7950 RepID=A0A6P8G6G3_CLUHA|nr:centrosomal protein of 170 kDa isoform X3 [Clupea harengus]